jgi:hypothetical protein
MGYRQFLLPFVFAALASAQLVSYAVVRKDAGQPQGPLMATIEGREVRVAPQAILSWIYSNGEGVLYTAPADNGAQVLVLYHANTGRRQELLREPLEIYDVAQVHPGNRRRVVIVSMRDGKRVPSFAFFMLPEGTKRVVPNAVVTRITSSALEFNSYKPDEILRVKGEVDLLKPADTERIPFQ